jgi:aspartate racemase
MHKRIGIVGGLSPESTVTYYLWITREYTKRYGDYGYPEILIYSVCFQAYVDWPEAERWDLVATGLSSAAKSLEAAGADFIVIASNTMHLVVEEIRKTLGIPVLSLLDVVADAIVEKGLTQVGLIGTRFSMEQGFYQKALAQKGITLVVPNTEDRQHVNRVIYEELVAGKVETASRDRYIAIIGRLAAQGAQGLILGCTEITLLISQRDIILPVFDSTTLHAKAALDLAVRGLT